MLFQFIKKYPKQIDVALLISGFILGANYFVFLKLGGLEELGFHFSPLSYGFHWTTPTLLGILIGINLSILEFRVLPTLSSRAPHYLMFLIRFFTFTVTITLSALLVHTFTDLIFYGRSLADSMVQTKKFIFSSIFITLFVYLILLGMTLNFFRAIGNRFGHGILINYLFGKYREPVEEHRIFMFIDLNSSTKIAEQLGHVKYSRLLNKCFGDLAALLPKYDAEIYQYVGDEAVMTWNMGHLESYSSPAFLFFEFEEALKKNKKDYMDKFGIFPKFKASIHAGAVIVTELGARRKELAYHGDVLNTASRVLELCSKLKKQLLTTSTLMEAFGREKDLSVSFLSNLVLRGKNSKTAVYNIEKLV